MGYAKTSGATLGEAWSLAQSTLDELFGNAPIWPDEYAQDTAECAWRFVLDNLWTWNEAVSEEQPYPDKPYLEEICHEWHECKASGQVLITEKCRRMIYSWLSRGLELHQMGLGRCDQILGGEDLEAAAKHVWRLKFLYGGLRKRRPAWRLPAHSELRYEGERKLKAFGLPNGSICNYANGQAGGLQGEGIRIITLEEFSIYRYPANMLAQAKIITQGAATGARGFVHLIGNGSTSEEWQRIKHGGDSGAGKEDASDRGALPEAEA